MYFIETRQLGLEPESARKDKQTSNKISNKLPVRALNKLLKTQAGDIFLLTFYENSLRLCEHKCKIFLSLLRHIKKQLGKGSKNFFFARILKPNKPAKDRLVLSKKSTDDCYLIAVKNKKSSFIPEQRKKRLNNFLEISIHLKYLIRRNNKRFSVQEKNLWSNFFHQL